jgi:tripartite-type tricarboxylate transporter receptor subunit TctC
MFKWACTLVLWTGFLLAPAAAQSPAEFYKGKTITIVVGFSTGGGYDLYARMLARHMGKYIPGAPTVIVQNMPGAGSLTAVRSLDTRAPGDGTVIVAFNPGLIIESLTDPKRIGMKFSDLAWLGSTAKDMRVCYAWHATGLKTWQDIASRKEFIIGGTAAGSSSYINAATLKNVFGLPIRQVLGYPGSAEQRIAIERGELEGDCGTWSSITLEWREAKKVNAFVRFSRDKTPDMPDAPYIGDFAKTQDQKDLINILTSASVLGVPYVMSKRVPADRLKTLRQAFDQTVRDPAFKADADKLLFPVLPIGGEEAEQVVDAIYKAPPELIEKAKEAIK